MQEERIQKILARAGYGSRRQIERWVESGEIIVNGVKASQGQKITENDRVTLRGQNLRLATKLRVAKSVLLYHKKPGEICTRDDPEGRETVYKNLPDLSSGRWISIGRLDINTDGLLLFTNDGELANKLMHPSSEVEREYAVRVLGDVKDEMLERLKKGVDLDGEKASFDSIRFIGGEGANQWYHVILKEGRNREVRRLWESQGLIVSRLRRVRYGIISLERSLRSGKYELLSRPKMRKLYESVGLDLGDFPVELRNAKGSQHKKRGNNYNPRHTPTKTRSAKQKLQQKRRRKKKSPRS
ncbi:MAG: pseudouridine synthase [Thiotrichaceae bacterium]|nr:pseudouridine synthase [Thiotrichaceae bacterium]